MTSGPGRGLRRAGALLLVLLAGCSDQEPEPPRSLEAVLLTAADLPAGFEPAPGDDTITTFCAGQDAAAGLRAAEREVAAFARRPAGASVIQVVLRLEGDGAPRFVEQADGLLETCSEVPDGSGLAFAYEPVSASVAAALEPVDGAVSGYGTSVGSGTLTVQIAVAHRGDVAMLVAVLGVDQPRPDLDRLAAEVFAAALERLPSP